MKLMQMMQKEAAGSLDGRETDQGRFGQDQRIPSLKKITANRKPARIAVGKLYAFSFPVGFMYGIYLPTFKG